MNNQTLEPPAPASRPPTTDADAVEPHAAPSTKAGTEKCSDAMLAAALEYARRGWAVLPITAGKNGRCSCGNIACDNAGKHPCWERGLFEHGVTEATQDPQKICALWTRFPEANIGIATGKKSGLVVIDVDPRHDGFASIAALEAEHGPLPKTLKALTGGDGGGYHLYFQRTEGETRIGNKTALLPGLDVRADGGYVIAPPSLHISGKRYEWEDPVLSIAPLPAWLLGLLTERTASRRMPGAGTTLDLAVTEGERDNWLTSEAGKLRRQGATADEMYVVLRGLNERHCKPPKPDHDVRRIATSVARYDAVPSQPESSREGQPDWAGPDETRPQFAVVNGRFCRVAHSRTGDAEYPRLCNFTAKVTAQVVILDGTDNHQRYFRIEGNLDDGTHLRPVDVPAADFSGMDWIPEEWGYGPSLPSGRNARDVVREAIEAYTGPHVPNHTVYAHIGWERINDQWVYLHAGGALGENGPVAAIDVRLSHGLERYKLPEPPREADLQKSVRESLALLDLGPPSVTVPLLGAVFRSVLGGARFGINVEGETGCFKSETAAVFQSHFGAFSGDSLPGSWMSTALSNAALMNLVHDAILVLDDYNPKGSRADVERAERDADRVFRGLGNNAGRNRCNPDGSLKGAARPNALVISTAEQNFRGGSLVARAFSVHMKRGDVEPQRLSVAQGKARRLVYARTTAGFVQWLAPRLDAIRVWSPSRVAELRTITAPHTRTADNIAHLVAGFEVFLSFAVDVGAISREEAVDTRRLALDTLQGDTGLQAALLAEEKPAFAFLRFLRAAIVAGEGHLAAAQGGEAPVDCARWGWQWELRGDQQHIRARGSCAGWVDDKAERIYLAPEAAYGVAQRMADRARFSLPPVSTLKRDLHEAGLLAITDKNAPRNAYTHRVMVGSSRQEALVLRLDALEAEATPSETGEGAVKTSPGDDAWGP